MEHAGQIDALSWQLRAANDLELSLSGAAREIRRS